MTVAFRSPRTPRAMAWSAIAWTTTSLIACVIAFGIGGAPALGSAAIGAGAGALFPVVTAVAAIVPDRRHGTRRYAAVAFFAFLVAFVVKVVVFIAAISLIVGMLDVVPAAVYGALVATASASLVVDVVFANGIRPAPETS